MTHSKRGGHLPKAFTENKILMHRLNIVFYALLIFALLFLVIYLGVAAEIDRTVHSSGGGDDGEEGDHLVKTKGYRDLEARTRRKRGAVQNSKMLNEGWYGYRIGDLVLYAGINNLFMMQGKENIMYYHAKNFPNSIASAYMRETKSFFRHRDFEAFFNVCDKKCPALMEKLFQKDETVRTLLTDFKDKTAIVHLRLGDAVSGEKAKKATGVTPATYVHVANLLAKKGIEHVIVVCGIHVPDRSSDDKSMDVYNEIKGFFDKHKINVYMSSNDPDTDMCLISGAEKLVYCSKSGMSLLAGKRCKKRNNFCFDVMNIKEEYDKNKTPYGAREKIYGYKIKQRQKTIE